MPVVRCLVVLLLCSSSLFTADLRTLSGKTVTGELAALNEKDGIVIATKDGAKVPTPLVNVVQLDLAPPTTSKLPPCTRVELVDGSVFYCKPEDGVRIVNKNQLDLTLLSGLKATVPLAGVHVILKDAHDGKVRDHADWKKCLEIKRPDVVAKWNKDRSRINGYKGSFIEEGDGIAFKFRLEGRENEEPKTIELTDASIQGLIFTKQVNPTAAPSVCKLDDLDQCRLVLAAVELKNDALIVVTVAGGKVQYPLKQVSRLDFSKGKIEYLSDLPKDGVNVEVKIEEQPDEKDRLDRIRFNKNLNDDPLQLRVVKDGHPNGVVERFDHGLALPAPAKLVYRLNGEYDEFTAMLGVDEMVGGDSRVRVVIEGDGVELFAAEVTRTAVRIKGREVADDKLKRAERVTLNVNDVKELRIKVEPVNPVFIYGNHVDLADAKISKASK